ncbi:DUF1788 domain-containing protein [Tsukamurella sp. PLM1]|uniref:DUF1788 domain-containing protein n=1 Tax=Tsukamurella sp. PLM1 TaxID=2929795 RepID=UPI002053EDCC|nr:DUF1788 domain-containing protein [Tsukamurella sp. PLM1]BDH57367.1 hypothetical protein MTP03_23060 [Tsukamurella sp. PLM1]
MTEPIRESMLPAERFDLAYSVMRSDDFLHMRGQLGEVPYFILGHPPADEPEVGQQIKRLVGRLRADGIEVCEVDLWALARAMWDETGQWDQILEQESALPKEAFADVGNVISPEKYLSPRITSVVREQEPAPQVVLLTHVGRLYPLVRAHAVLNTLQPLLSDLPVVLVFPGEYRQSPTQGASLVLFGQLLDDDYYRAFDLLKLGNP